MRKSTFKKKVEKLAKEFGFPLQSEGDIIHLAAPNAPLTINLDITGEVYAFVYLSLRFTSWDAPGERTDLNEFYSLFFSSFFRVLGDFSCTIFDVEHPVAEVPDTEVYARYFTLTQPNNSTFPFSEAGVELLKGLVAKTWFFNHIMPEALDWSVEHRNGVPHAEPGYSWDDVTPWAENIAQIMNEPLDDLVQFASRRNPTWKHYRSIATSITLFEAPNPAEKLTSLINGEERWKILNGPTGRIFLSGAINNFASNESIEKLTRLLQTIETTPDISFVPIENFLIGVTRKHIACIAADCSNKEFELEREKIRKRHETEQKYLFPAKTFQWSNQIDGDRFELFVLDLLKREHGVMWARKVSVSSERDGGRDVVSEWKLPAFDPTVPEDVTPSETIRVIVQSKAFSRPIGKGSVTDIRDTVEHFDAQGYLLVISHYLTTTLTDHLERERRRKKIYIDWWTRSEIEDRLRRDGNSDLLKMYTDIVVPITN